MPSDRADAAAAFREAWELAVTERVEVAWVREHYHPRAVETPWQRWYVQRFAD